MNSCFNLAAHHHHSTLWNKLPLPLNPPPLPQTLQNQMAVNTSNIMMVGLEQGIWYTRKSHNLDIPIYLHVFTLALSGNYLRSRR